MEEEGLIGSTNTNNKQGALTNSGHIVLEEGKSLSESIIWKLQREYFERHGIYAWVEGTVPHYITSNPFIANAYARMVLGFIRDCCTPTYFSGTESLPHFDINQPIFIIELGAGSGRFTYHFLRKFLRFYENSSLRQISIKYIMTDFIESNIQYWRAHPLLKQFFREGILDTAFFNAEGNGEIKFTQSEELLSYVSNQSPAVIIANYFFDSIPQDVFFIKDSKLYEGIVTVHTPLHEISNNDKQSIPNFQVSYAPVSIEADYYSDSNWNEILKYYKIHLNDTAILFPTSALKCIDFFNNFLKNRILILSGDKGYSHEIDLQGRNEPKIMKHGSFSMMVNYHAIGEYIQKLGGQVLQTRHRHVNLNISGFLLGSHPYGYPETKQAYDDTIENLGPDDFYTVKKAIENQYDTWNLEQILAYLRLSGFDSRIFLDCYPAIMDSLNQAQESIKEELYNTIKKVWEVYYSIAEDRDLASHLGVMLYEMGYYNEALKYFKSSVDVYGPDSMISYNLGLCFFRLKQMDIALEHMKTALALSPDFKDAKAMGIIIEKKIKQKES
jgi:tetratricopeptide (TPR) repeat protein